MKKFIKIIGALVVLYLLIGLIIYLMADSGVRGPILDWLLFWPAGLMFYSHIS